MWHKPKPPRIDARQRAILDQDFPRFSGAEMARRHEAVAGLMEEAEVDHLLLCGAGWFGASVPWLTGWPVSVEALAVYTPDEATALYVQYFNHVPLARRLAHGAEVHWGGARTIVSVEDELERRGAANRRIGVIGPLDFANRDALKGVCADVIDLNRQFVGLRLVKSEEELDWFRIGSAMSDLSIDALIEELRPGLTERDLGDIVEHAYVPWGCRTVIHFFGTAAMDAPNLEVPAQYPSNRAVAQGDVVFTELSADFWGYGGQVLRSFTIGQGPNALYRDLHDAASGAFDAICAVLRPGCHAQEVQDASEVIEHAGFTTCDDLIHGYGGGYFPPILGSKSRPNEPVPDFTFAEGMMVVVQPNVTNKEGTAGVQTGECMLITADGARSMHDAPRGLIEIPAR